MLVKMASFDSSSSNSSSPLSPPTLEVEVPLEALVEALFGTAYIGGILPLTPLTVVYPEETSGATLHLR